MAEPISSAGAVQAHLGQVVEVRGRYDVWDLGPHRVLLDLPGGRTQAVRQVVNLVLADASVLRLWVRPEAEMQALRGTAVVARGRLLAASQPAMPASTPADAPSLLEIESIDAA
ncbi:MAG: hypothetical protein JNL87_11265 [Burkholderiaceae bacterium]|nr:hypothetical protein [Burkholderiaceae bacterium]